MYSPLVLCLNTKHYPAPSIIQHQASSVWALERALEIKSQDWIFKQRRCISFLLVECLRYLLIFSEKTLRLLSPTIKPRLFRLLSPTLWSVFLRSILKQSPFKVLEDRLHSHCRTKKPHKFLKDAAHDSRAQPLLFVVIERFIESSEIFVIFLF